MKRTKQDGHAFPAASAGSCRGADLSKSRNLACLSQHAGHARFRDSACFTHRWHSALHYLLALSLTERIPAHANISTIPNLAFFPQHAGNAPLHACFTRKDGTLHCMIATLTSHSSACTTSQSSQHTTFPQAVTSYRAPRIRFPHRRLFPCLSGTDSKFVHLDAATQRFRLVSGIFLAFCTPQTLPTCLTSASPRVSAESIRIWAGHIKLGRTIDLPPKS